MVFDVVCEFAVIILPLAKLAQQLPAQGNGEQYDYQKQPDGAGLVQILPCRERYGSQSEDRQGHYEPA